MDITQEMQEMIAKHLPAQVGTLLQERLAKADSDAKKVVELQAKVAQLEMSVREHDHLTTRERKLKELETQLNQRATVIDARENRMEVFEAKLQTEEAKKRADMAERFVGLVFHSPVFTRSINGYQPIVTPANGYVNSGNVNLNETITAS